MRTYVDWWIFWAARFPLWNIYRVCWYGQPCHVILIEHLDILTIWDNFKILDILKIWNIVDILEISMFGWKHTRWEIWVWSVWTGNRAIWYFDRASCRDESKVASIFQRFFVKIVTVDSHKTCLVVDVLGNFVDVKVWPSVVRVS